MGILRAKSAKFTPCSVSEDARRDYAGEEDAAQAAIADESDHSWPEEYTTEDSQDGIQGEEYESGAVQRVHDGPLGAVRHAIRVTTTRELLHIFQRLLIVRERRFPAFSIVPVER